MIAILWRYKWIILACLLSLYASYQKMRYDAIVKEYESFKTELSTQARLQEQQNEIIETNTNNDVMRNVTQYNDDYKLLKIDRDKLKKELANVKTLTDYRINAYADRLQITNASASQMPEASSDSCELAESERERDTAYIKTLERAGASCAIDFNLARGWIDSVCDNHVCAE